MRALIVTLATPLLVAAHAACAQEPIWLVNCSNQTSGSTLSCDVAQSIVVAETNQRLATTRFFKDAGSSETTAAITLPLGLFLPAGVSLSAGENDLGNAQVEACDGDGCYAAIKLTDGWEEQLAGQDVLIVSAQTLARETISFSFPLDGFPASWSLVP